ncbi:MAG TPA: hypothetical protein ENN56_03230 [Firmicutes bacterium]|nr:hypothetical protein [Bacillota bacterium]
MNEKQEKRSIDGYDDSSHLVNLAGLIWRRRKTVIGTITLIVGITIVALLIAKPQFTARATFMPPPDGSGGLASMLRDPINAILGRGGGTSMDRLVNFLDSRVTRDLIVDKYDLRTYYEVDYIDEARKALANATDVSVSPEGLVRVDVTDKDRVLAAQIANEYVDIADSLYVIAQREYAGQMRRFLETRVEQNLRDLSLAEEAARAFSEQYGVVSLPNQVAALIDQLAQVEAQIRTLDMRIGAAREILGPNHVSVRELRVEREMAERERRKLLQSNGATTDPFLAFQDIPVRALEYARLEREIKIQSIIQELLFQQYEVAKLEEARNVSSLTRVDTAIPPELKSWPPRTRIVLVTGIIAFVWAIFVAWFVERWPDYRRRIVESGGRT